MKGMEYVVQKGNRYKFWGLFFNPITIIIYTIGCYYLYKLCQYGGVRKRLPIILGCFVSIFIWFIICLLINHYRKKHKKAIEDGVIVESKARNRIQPFVKIWFVVALLAFFIITGITGARVYHSGMKYNGRLSWIIEDLKNKRRIEFSHDNIFENGIEGILQDINQKENLPEELYLSSSFSLEFASDGTILKFDTYLYGKNQDGETESFLITYNREHSKEITLYLNGAVSASYDESKKFTPLSELMNVIPIKETVSQWSSQKYGILYYGVRNWGYNTEGIVYIDKNGNTWENRVQREEIVGYTVSVYVPGKEETNIPVRYIASWEEVEAKIEMENSETTPEIILNIATTDDTGNMTFYLSEEKGYRLSVVDAAAGSRFYDLSETGNGGETWNLLNSDPFLSNGGVAAGLCFINETLGFITLSHSGGSYGEMYRTEDGGITYELVEIPVIEVSLNEVEMYNPFDLPDVPTASEEILQLLVGQGQDGDYHSGSKALFQSVDNGVTWKYIKEVTKE